MRLIGGIARSVPARVEPPRQLTNGDRTEVADHLHRFEEPIMSTLSIMTLHGQEAPISSDVLLEFTSKIGGEVMRKGDPGYDDARRIWNGMVDRSPALIVRCTGSADVVQAIAFARQHQLLLAVRSGGHNIAGNAVCEGGLMIDLSAMTAVRVDPVAKTARVEPGATLADLDRDTRVGSQGV